MTRTGYTALRSPITQSRNNDSDAVAPGPGRYYSPRKLTRNSWWLVKDRRIRRSFPVSCLSHNPHPRPLPSIFLVFTGCTVRASLAVAVSRETRSSVEPRQAERPRARSRFRGDQFSAREPRHQGPATRSTSTIAQAHGSTEWASTTTEDITGRLVKAGARDPPRFRVDARVVARESRRQSDPWSRTLIPAPFNNHPLPVNPRFISISSMVIAPRGQKRTVLQRQPASPTRAALAPEKKRRRRSFVALR